MELKLENISKSYNGGKTWAVRHFSCTLTPGVYGLLGPNGAGKSTLMNIMTNNLLPDEGAITLDGAKIEAMGADYRGRLGYMPQQQSLYADFTGEQFLWYMAALKGMPRSRTKEAVERMLEVVNLGADRHKKLKAYSGGMKQRILIAQALLDSPDILLLDEPTAGLDPRERIRIRNYISECARDKIVLLATHVVSDVEAISREIILLRAGQIVRQGTPQALLAELEGKVFEVLADPEDERYYNESGWRVANVMLTTGKTSLRIVSDTVPPQGQVQRTRPCLEDVYLYWVE